MKQSTSGAMHYLPYRLLSFLLPAALYAAAYAVLGVFPFGEKTLLVADMNNEYIDYLAHLHRAVRQGGSLLRSWNMGMGLNMMGLLAFYISSPFYLLALLFPLEYLTEAIFLITLLKTGLCGLTFCVYLEYTVSVHPAFLPAFGVAYGLNGYCVAYASNLMWLDGVAFLPLVLLGVEKLLRENRHRLFLLSLIYCFLTSYYISYMIGLFAFAYLTAAWLRDASGEGFRNYLQVFGRFLLDAVAAAGCCAFLLLPAFLNLAHGQDVMWDTTAPPSFALEQPIVSSLAKLLPGAFDTLTDSGTPNLYCTLAGALGAALFFCNCRIARREKVISGSVLLLLLFSFSCEFLYMGWHAFEDPTWYPARFSFLFCFWMLYMAARCAGEWRGVSPVSLGIAAGLFLLLVTEVLANRFVFLQPEHCWPSVGLVCAYAILAYGVCRLHPISGDASAPSRRAISCYAWLFSLLVCLEGGWNAWRVASGIDSRFRYRTRESYTAFREERVPLLETAASLDSGVYRTELTEYRNANGGMALGYYPISHYSTTTDQALNRLLTKVGYNSGIINELYFAPNTPFTNGLMGIRYVIASEKLPGYSHLMQSPTESSGLGLYQNPLAFPLAYYADSTALEFDPSGSDPFYLQNNWVDSLWERTASPPFLPLQVLGEERHQIQLEVPAVPGYMQYTSLSREGNSYVEWTISNPDRLQAYAFFPVHGHNFSNAYVEVNDNKQRELAYRNNTVIDLGNGEEIVLRLSLSSSRMSLEGVYFYGLDWNAASQAAQTAQDLAMDFSTFADTRVEGYIHAPREGALITSFPFDKGWHIKIDGQTVHPVPFAGVFLALPLEEGEHTVEMRYYPPGFLPGCAISVLTLSGLSILFLFHRGKKSLLPPS